MIRPARLHQRQIAHRFIGCLWLLCAGLGLVSGHAAAQQTAFVGTTGILSTPDALIADAGALNYQYNSLLEPRFQNAHSRGTNHVFALGVYSRFELGGRLTDFIPEGERVSNNGALAGVRDLSGNTKLNFYRFGDVLWFSAGAIDFGGLAQKFSTSFAVATARWRNLWVSAGAASGDENAMNGGFANVHWRVNRYASLMAERDTYGATNVGLTASLPLTASLTFGATVSSGDDDVRVGANISYQLGLKVKPSIDNLMLSDASGHEHIGKDSESSVSIESNNAPPVLTRLEKALSDTGFHATRVGTVGDGNFIVQVENKRFAHTDYDALDITSTLAHKHLPNDADIEINLLNQGVIKFRALYSGNDQTSRTLDNPPTRADRSATVWTVSRYATAQSLADFTIQPELRSAVGTEFGTIDYTLGVRAGISIPLWHGSKLAIASIVPVHNSSNFDEGKPYARERFELSLERALLTQYLPLSPNIHTQWEIGEVQVRNFHYTAVKAQAAWQSTQLPVLLHASAAQYRLKDSEIQRNVFLGTARYTLPRFQASLSATYGQFLFGETGVKLAGIRRFGNTFASVFLKIVSSDDLVGGLQISAPIGPRKAVHLNRFTLAGASRWQHGLQTTIKFPGTEDNRIQYGFLHEPLLDSEIPLSILDSGRLNPFDFYQHVYPSPSS